MCLLDISGDAVHMVSNAAKALISPFKDTVEDFCADVYYDIEKFPKQKEIFAEFQSLLHMEKKSLIRPISSRFLQMLEVCNRIRELLDPLIVHHFSFLSPHDQHKYRWLLNQVLEKHGVTSAEKARVSVLQQQLAKSTKGQTDTNRDRKTRISVLFTEFNKLTAIIDLYRGILPPFQVFLKRLQHEKPMLHILHVEMGLLVRDLLSKFMKPDAIPLDVKGLLKLDFQNRDLHYPDKLLAVGKFSYFALNKARVEKSSWVGEVYSSLREGYVKAATFLLKNLPLANEIISSLSALSPSLMQDQHIRVAFSTLAKFLLNTFTSDELDQLDEEVREYQIGLDLGVKAKGFDDNESRIDVDWWREVFSMKMAEGEIRFPLLGKLVRALLSVFTGPLIEGSFNIMDDIIEKDRVKLSIETYEGFAVIVTPEGSRGDRLNNENQCSIEEIMFVVLWQIQKLSEETEGQNKPREGTENPGSGKGPSSSKSEEGEKSFHLFIHIHWCQTLLLYSLLIQLKKSHMCNQVLTLFFHLNQKSHSCRQHPFLLLLYKIQTYRNVLFFLHHTSQTCKKRRTYR
ncbi:uncharacterized protein LOC132887834 [Neoarius graeffei]|uniref:uncharacterized protein LOC132887834 n=1 Tax=Neoarius graeffei TaxID=443677 RepID=UPI00298CFCC9|nr:uncharacterized protein LOC132887834 [Neoarius graeffei]